MSIQTDITKVYKQVLNLGLKTMVLKEDVRAVFNNFLCMDPEIKIPWNKFRSNNVGDNMSRVIRKQISELGYSEPIRVTDRGESAKHERCPIAWVRNKSQSAAFDLKHFGIKKAVIMSKGDYYNKISTEN